MIASASFKLTILPLPCIRAGDDRQWRHCAQLSVKESWRQSHGAGDAISVIKFINSPQRPAACTMAIVFDCEADAEAAVIICLIGMDGLGSVIERKMARRMNPETAGVTVNILVNVIYYTGSMKVLQMMSLTRSGTR